MAARISVRSALCLERLESRLAPADLSLTRATYLGTAAADDAAAIAVSPLDGVLLIAADFDGVAKLQRYSTTPGAGPLSSIDLGGSDVRDAAVSGGNGRIVAVGNFGLKVLAGTGAPLWQMAGSFDRVAIADNGTVVALNTSTDTLTIWNQDGELLATTTLTGGDVRSADVAIDPLTQRIFVTGYTQATSTLQIPFVRAFDRSGSRVDLAWEAWDFAASDVNAAGLTADARGVRIEFGADGGLYFLGRTDGGNNVFGRDSNDLATPLGSRLVDPDQYTDTSNTSGAKTFTFFAKLRASDGYIERGQILVTRLSDGKANSFTPSTIAADRLGNVYVGGSSAFQLQDRDAQTINGAVVGSYRLGEPAVLSVSADFNTRRFWTALTANGDADGAVGSIAGFAVVGTSVALVGTISTPGVATVAGDVNPNPLGGADVYLATIANAVPAPTTLTVTSNADSGAGSLRDTIAAAPSNALIRFAPILANQTITLQSQLVVQRDLTIDGADAANLTLSGNASTRILLIDYSFIDVALRNLTFANGKAVDADAGTTLRGGAIELTDPNTLVVENCTFRNNVGERSGALFVGYAARATVINSTFDSNDGTPANDGFSAGGISTFGGGTGSGILPNGVGGNAFLDIRGCTFTNNKGSYGSVYTLLGGLRVEDTKFLNNVGVAGAGAIFTDGANGTEQSASVIGAETLIRNVIADGNSGGGTYGGAFFLYGYSNDRYVIENSTLTNNTAFRAGALGVQAAGPTSILIRNTTLANNTSLNQGGALWTDVGGTDGIRIENSTFSGNRNTDGKGGGTIGGAIVFNVGNSVAMSITNSSFVNNFSQEQSGCIWIAGATQAKNLTLTNTLFAGNRAPNFGGQSEQTVNFTVNGGGGNFIQLGGNGKFDDLIPGATAVTDLLLSPTLQLFTTTTGTVLLHTLSAGSPAIDGGVSGAPPFDQRGQARTDGDGVNGVQPDAGAFEAPAFGQPLFPVVTLTATNADQPEGNAGTTAFTFTVTRTGDVSAASSATWTVSGTADAADFGGTVPIGIVNFAVGETTATITVNVASDLAFEADEGFTLTLSNPVNASLATTTAAGTIRNDDAAPATPPTLTATGTAPSGVVGTAYTFTPFTATGTPSPTFSATGLPDGLTINPNTGTISGTPTTAGTFTVSVTATNSAGGAMDSFALTIAATGVAPVFTNAPPTTGQVGQPFSFSVTASGTPTPSFNAIGLPAGLSIDPTTGIISGTPTTAGTVTGTITASNGIGTATQAFTLTIAPTLISTAPTLTSNGTPPTATSNTPYEFTPFTVIGTTPITFSATGLPTGLTISATTGTISGVPTSAGTFTTTVTASSGVAPDASGTVTLTVNAVSTGTTPTITSTPITTARVGRVVNFPVTATGDSPLTFSATGLPAGLTIDTTTGVISGDPTAFGTFVGTITATNAVGTATQNFTLTVARFFDPGFEIANVSGPSSGTARSFTFDPTNFQLTPVANAVAPFVGTGGVRSTSADVDGDGVADFIYATGPNVGTGDQLRIISGTTGKDLLTAGTFSAYAGEDFRTIGLFVQSADLDGDGTAEIVVSPDQGGGARVQIFQLVNGTLVQVANFFGIQDPDFRGGGRIAVGDVNNDRFQEVIVGAGFGGGPRIAIFDGKGLTSFGSAGTPPKLLGDFIVFNPGAELLRNGTWVSAGDTNGDGFADLVFGAGPGGGPRVTVFDGQILSTQGSAAADATPLANFFGGDVNQRGGIRVSLKDIDADRKLDLVVGSGEGAAAGVTTYLATTFPASGQGTPAVAQSFDPFDGNPVSNGIYVG